MVWLMLLAACAAAAIGVAVIWERLVRRGQGSDDEPFGTPLGGDSDALPRADSDHCSLLALAFTGVMIGTTDRSHPAPQQSVHSLNGTWIASADC
jgi:hypothetical protein